MKDDPKFNTEFVQIIQQYPVIYDYTLSGYSKRIVVDKAWDEIVEIIKTKLNENCSAEDCKVRWKGLRSSFNRYRNKRLTAEKEGRPYYLYDALQFISPFTKTRASTMIDLNVFNPSDDLPLEESDSEQLIGNSADLDDQVKLEIEDDYILELGPEIVSKKEPECSSTTQPKYQSQSNVLEPEAIITEDSEDGCSRRSVKRKYDEPRNDPYMNDLNFFKSILPDIKDFTPQQNRKFKIRVLELIDEIEKLHKKCA